MRSLRNALMAHVAAAVAGSFLLVAAGVVWHALEAQRQASASTADRLATRLARQLEMERTIPLHGAPWVDEALALDSALRPGQCVAFQRPGDPAPERHCQGNEPSAAELPAWFRAAWPAAGAVERRVALRGESAAWLRVESDPAQAAALAWARGLTLLGLAAGTLAIAWLLSSLLVRRALVPLQAWSAALDRLARGDGAPAPDVGRLRELEPLRARFDALSEALARRTEERDALLRRLVEVQEAERAHIARELHDQLGQQLAAVQALAGSIEAGADRPDLQQEAARIQQIVAPMMANLRSLLVQLRPPGLAEFGLVRTLAHLVEEWDRTARGPRCRLEAADDLGALPDAVAVHVFRAAQECLTNAVKHAGASHILVRLRGWAEAARAGLELVVQDDGSGPDETPSRRPGLGLLGLRERAAMLGGRLELERLAPRGHRVRLWVPTTAAQAQA